MRFNQIQIASAATTHIKAHRANSGANHRGPRGGPPVGGPPVHSVSVIPNKEGTAFDTVTADGGVVQSVSEGNVLGANAALVSLYLSEVLTSSKPTTPEDEDG